MVGYAPKLDFKLIFENFETHNLIVFRRTEMLGKLATFEEQIWRWLYVDNETAVERECERQRGENRRLCQVHIVQVGE
jgi:hypothetical protein